MKNFFEKKYHELLNYLTDGIFESEISDTKSSN
jgi:hypothetical protein